LYQTAWHLAADENHVEILEKLWEFVKELQLKPEDLRDEVWLSKGEGDRTAWHLAKRRCHIEVLE